MSRKKHIKIFWIGISVIFIILLLIGCGRTVYVPVETVKTEYKDRLQVDSIHLYDSIFVKIANDTVRIEKYKYKYKDKIVRDSVFINDTIRVPYPVTEYKEVNKLNNWQVILMILGGILIGICVFKIGKLIK